MIDVKPKGATVLVLEHEKDNQSDTTKAGIIIPSKEMDSGDKALLEGDVLTLGTPEIDFNGIKRVPDVEIGTHVWFNRYNAYRVITKGLETYWLVDCKDIKGIGNV